MSKPRVYIDLGPTENDRLKKEVTKIKAQFTDFIKKTTKILNEMRSSLKSNEEKLVKITEVNCSVEDTLSNAFLAIKQNAFLHAWYPGQQGHEEMKVIGRHPAQVKRKIV